MSRCGLCRREVLVTEYQAALLLKWYEVTFSCVIVKGGLPVISTRHDKGEARVDRVAGECTLECGEDGDGVDE
jgi:hypothetical protein